ncbi:TetR/AcrR family transcriptional regulator [Elizabethkingia sp. JS20170427COW]|uniref:TetR/AcrR family transcriptional regulator n=1 Tax=Elizabethkingia sp. JS20170427COW TaxID=2583851 RepID=UPI00111092A2|nr:TetR/AcrR family transcriptional regulator [Elizabethkingia sp. JS20170427COW]QCX53592.1 TetR/AcrR family transcriptional regulator [Elizabethkingia sp. JS20170427COW]
MSKEQHKIDTEDLIKQTAKQLFFGEGKFKATTQEIADAAGVNRTSINYYFRSRDNLFDIVLEEAINKVNDKHYTILISDLPFRTKLEMWLDDELASAIKYPFLEVYIVTQMQSKCKHIRRNKNDVQLAQQALEKELAEEIKQGRMKPISTTQFMINIASLVSFPSCMRPLLMDSFDLDNERFTQIIKERKQVILDLIFK